MWTGAQNARELLNNRQDSEGFIVLLGIGRFHVHQICLHHSIRDIGQSCFCMNELVSEFRDVLVRLTYRTF
jgi:hypothetical protein